MDNSKLTNFLNVQIETDRLKLFPISLNYTQDIFTQLTPKVVKYMTLEVHPNLESVENYINERVRRLTSKEGLVMIVIHKNTNEFLGICALHNTNSRKPEIGLWIKSSASGHGFGREAVKGLIKWATENLDFDYLDYPVDGNNSASINLIEKLGGEISNEVEKVTTSDGRKLDIIHYRFYI